MSPAETTQPPGSGALSAPVRSRRWLQLHTGLFRASAAQYLTSLFALMALSPFLESFRNGDLIESAMLTLVLLSGVLAVGARRRVLILAIALMVPAILARWLSHIQPNLLSPTVQNLPAVALVIFIFLQLLRFVLAAIRVDSEVLCAGVAGYLTLGLVWTLFYLMLSCSRPGAFAPAPGPMDSSTALYFSLITMTTVGYGDITPVSGAARMLATLQAIAGTFYVAILISRLVALHTANAQTAPGSQNPPGNSPSAGGPNP